MRGRRICAILACLTVVSTAREPASWSVAHGAHFEVYSDGGAEGARSLAAGLDRLHAFFSRQLGLMPPPQREVRVIAFATQREYEEYRIRPGAGAYFLGAEDRDYIVLPASPRGELRMAAHEYAHVLMHSAGWSLPAWMAEGIGDVVSTVQLRDRESRIGGDLPERSAALRGKRLPLAELFAMRTGDAVFYAESWAVVDLLMLGPTYSSRFPSLLAALAAGAPSERAIADVYGVSLAVIERDVRARHFQSMALPAIAGDAAGVRINTVTPFAARALLADLRFANGDVETAGSLYRGLAQERPSDAAVHGALGTIALRRGDNGLAAAEWARAIDLRIADAKICFRYAILADERGLPVRPALERAIALQPDFDDARFKLALLEKNAGHAETAIAQLRAMRQVTPARAFAWWTALADALLDINRRAEAKQAAVEARAHAATGEEREHADRIEWMADTELAVEIEGRQFHTVRVPVGDAVRNPFIEAGDGPRRVEATLREVECAESGLQLRLDTAQGALTLAVPDPSRVQIRNAGTAAFEFTCGAQEPRSVLVEYAASMVLRGLELR